MHALLIIDMQEAYFKTPGLVSRKSDLVKTINDHIRLAQKNHEPILTIRTVHLPDKTTWTLNMLQDDQGFSFEGSDESKSITSLALDQTIDIVKTRDNAFQNTELLDFLNTKAIDHVTLTGVSTHSCIFQTAAAAYANNIKVTIDSNAVDDENELLQQQALEYLQREYRQQII